MIALDTVGIVLRADLRAVWNRLRKRSTGRLVAFGVLLLLAAVVVGGGAFSLGAAVGRFLAPARDPVLAGSFTALSVLMLVVGFPSVIATFFVGRDLLQLVVAPVRPMEIFIARAALAMTANVLVSAILLASVFGIGAGAGASPVYYPLAVVLVFNQVLLITAVQALLMSVILRWVPARIARDGAAALAAVTGAGLYLLWNINVRQSFSVRRGAPDLANLATLGQRVDWLPSAWPGHALDAVASGSAAAATAWIVLSVALAVVVVVAAELLYARTLLTGVGLFGSASAPWRQPRTVRRAAAGTGIGSPLRAIARKDWLGYRRDVRRLTRLLPALLFPMGYALAFLRPSRGLSGFWSEVFLIGFLTMFMSSVVGTPAVPSERRGFQLLRLAPIAMWQVIRAKIAAVLPPVLALSTIFAVVVGIASGIGAASTAAIVLLALWLATGLVAIDVSAGAIDPRFESADDRRAIGLVGTLAGLGGSLAYALLALGALALLRLSGDTLAGTANLGPIPATPAVGAVLAGAGLLALAGSAAIAITMLVVGNSRLSRFEATIDATG